ncbi:MAG TPA: SCO family protein [Stellaceae bacterium]|jgi:protein SCO1|nr:SCO family protein [Stellaceae bacterium]
MTVNPTDGPGAGPTAKRPRHLWFAASVLAGLIIIAAAAFLAIELHEASRGAGGTLLGSAIGGPFQLEDQNGRTVTNTALEGKWLLVYFGYTHCPDVCPTALNNIAVALHDLGKKSGEVRPVFITIDPARDTPQTLKNYVEAFDAPILALTGNAEEIAQAASDYRVYYAKHPEPDGDYSMDHSSIIYVMDPKGRFSASLNAEEAPAQMAARLRQLLG